MRCGLSRAINRGKNRNSLSLSLDSNALRTILARFSLRVVDFIVRNLDALKTRLVKPDDLRLHPQPFNAFRWQVHHCFNAGLYAANDVFMWAAAPVISCVKSIENRSHAFSAVKGANQVLAVRVMQRITTRNNIDPVALV